MFYVRSKSRQDCDTGWQCSVSAFDPEIAVSEPPHAQAEAIAWAWELLTTVYKLDSSRLYATYFGGDASQGLEPDEEAKNIWYAKGIAPDMLSADTDQHAHLTVGSHCDKHQVACPLFKRQIYLWLA
jgi:hypothetical protein